MKAHRVVLGVNIECYSSTIQKYINDPNVSRAWVVNALLEEAKRLEIELQEEKNERLP